MHVCKLGLYKPPAFSTVLMSTPWTGGGGARLTPACQPHPIPSSSAVHLVAFYTWLESHFSLFHLIGHWVFLPACGNGALLPSSQGYFHLNDLFLSPWGASLLPTLLPLCLLQILLMLLFLQEPLSLIHFYQQFYWSSGSLSAYAPTPVSRWVLSQVEQFALKSGKK